MGYDNFMTQFYDTVFEYNYIKAILWHSFWSTIILNNI